MIPFDFQLGTRIVFGPGVIERLGELATELGGRRVIVVSDPGVVAAGHTARGIASLEHSGLTTILFDQVHPNPTTDDVEACHRAARDFRPDLIVGLGGGSSMDCAKGLNFVYTNGGRMQDYWGVGKARRDMLPMIAVPTTAGTGSETQSFALISDAETHVKMACGDRRATCRIALLDPELTRTQPSHVTAVTGIDAVAHAIETFVTKPRNGMSELFSRESWRLLSKHFPHVLEDPDDLEARAAMQLGATFAGVAIENSMLGAAHALANPLTARYGVVHGQAVALMLPHVVRYNAAVCEGRYAELVHLVDSPPSASAEDRPDDQPADQPAGLRLAQWLESTRQRAGLRSGLREFEIPHSALPQLAEEASRQWTATFNPRPVDAESLEQLYEAAW